MDANDQDQDRDLAKVSQAIDALSEFFDTVQIFVTRHENSEVGTISVQKGSGNWYARVGQVHEWMTKNSEETREDVRENRRD
jgi:hypothetical protein